MREILVDAHVHLHPGADPWDSLTHAHDRMTARRGADCLTVFMLAEQAGCDMFAALRPRATPTQESESLWLRHGSSDLLLLAGRQVVSAEKLEILALATAEAFPDGQPARDSIATMQQAQALIILPWGVGKWIGRRGRLVDRLLAQDAQNSILLGDNGGRPLFWPEPRFRRRPVLRGSDPLPLPGDARRIGSFGARLHGTLSRETPARDLRRLIRTAGQGIEPYGPLAGPLHFFGNQLRLRMAS